MSPSRPLREARATRAAMNRNTKKPRLSPGLHFNLGNFLLSHTLARAVPSGLGGLTSVFGMGTGGSLSLQSPKTCYLRPFASIRGQNAVLNIDGARNSLSTVDFMVKPNGLLVTVSSTPYSAYTPLLPTSSAST